MKTYFAIVHKDANSAVGVVFPDLPGCFSAGDTFDKAIANAHLALRLYAEAEAGAGRRLPKPRSFEALYRDPNVRQEARDAPFVGISLEENSLAPAGTKRIVKVGEAHAPSSKRLVSTDAPSGRLIGTTKAKKRGRKTG
jgi:predicted RNase H-like HicB family nuclease